MSDTRPGSALTGRIARKFERVAGRIRLRAAMKHLHGPRRFDLGDDDVVVVILVRDSAYYIDELFAHYRRLGARHFVVVDNGSTDDTIARLKAQPGTAILHCTLPIGHYEVEFRRHAAETFARGHWVLFADSDELFDYEGSDVLNLSALVRYLRAQGFTALVAQMLDLFPEGSIRDSAHIPFRAALKTYRHFDLSHIEPQKYGEHDGIEFSYFLRNNVLPTERIEFLFGGVRNRVFGELCCITKHPLVFLGDGVWPNPHPHCAANVSVADFTALLKHYKFTNDPLARDIATLAAGIVPHGADRLRVEVVRDNPDLSLHSGHSHTFTTVEALYDLGFLVRSDRFSAHVRAARDAAHAHACGTGRHGVRDRA